MRSLLIGLGLILGISRAFGLSLDEATGQAVSNNPELRGALKAWKASEAKITALSSLPDPAIEFSFGQSGSAYEGEMTMIGISQKIPFPFKILEARKGARLSSNAAREVLESRKRLLIVVPLCLLAILIMLYVEFDSIAIAGLIFSALPFAFVGGILLQHILGYKFSTAVWVGYIALFGVAVEDGLALVKHLRAKMNTWKGSTADLVIEGASWKLRPILMTTVTTVLALVPIMLSSGPGSEVMKPIATPIAGGMITATVLNLFVLPVLYSFYLDHRKGS